MDRGQAHTLEAIVAGLILLSSIIFALQMTAVTPLSASTSSQHIENQQKSVAKGTLATADERGALKPTLLYWNDTGEQFHGPPLGYYTNDPPNTTFGSMLERSFGQAGIAYNVFLVHQQNDSRSETTRLVYQGVPSDHAVRASRAVILTDDDRLYDSDGGRTGTTVSDSSTFYAQDVGTGVYNVVTVEVVVWRI